MTTPTHHQPVLLTETMDGLMIKPNGVYVDATFGRGGHSQAILQQLGTDGRLIALDRDHAAVEHGYSLITDSRFTLIHACFSSLATIIDKSDYQQIDGILLDLGVSSPQLDDMQRGMSFMRDGPLDMRMDQQQAMSAETWLARVNAGDLADVLRDYGEERYAKRIAQAIVNERIKNPITTTHQLRDIVSQAHPRWEKHHHPATRSFQAIRIFINRELEELQQVLPQCIDLLKVGGRLCVISFHSLEDRLVKQFVQQQNADKHPPDLPIPANQQPLTMKKIGGLIRPSEAEISRNRRARSARLRVVEKL